MSTLCLSPRRDWSAVTLREMRDRISDRAAGAPERLSCHWFGADFHDPCENFCRACAKKLVDQKYAADPKRFVYLYGDCDTAEERYRAAIDGGWSTDHDSRPYCVTCGEPLDGTLTDSGVDDEIDHAVSYPPWTPEGWDDLDLALINVRGEDMTLAQLRALPVPADKYNANRRAETLSIWERIAPLVVADMQRGGQ